MLTKVKVQAKDVNEAVKKGLKELHLKKDQVTIKVLEEPRKGFLGIGARPALVEVTKKRWNTNDLDAQIYMDLPKKSSRRNSKHGKRGSQVVHRSTKSLEIRIPRERTPKENEPQKLPSEAIQHAVIPEMLVAPMQEAKEYVSKVLGHMEIQVTNLNAWWDEKQQRILITLDCDQPAIIIGKEGKTLEAIQYLTTLSISRHFDKPISVIVDTQNYWRKAEDRIDNEIEKAIELIKSGNKIFRFRPMSAQLRRYIHHAIAGNELVTSVSEGEGKWRKVTLIPTQTTVGILHANQAPADFVPGVIGEDIPTDEKTNVAVANDSTLPVAENSSTVQAEDNASVVSTIETLVNVPTNLVTPTPVNENNNLVETSSLEENKDSTSCEQK